MRPISSSFERLIRYRRLMWGIPLHYLNTWTIATHDLVERRHTITSPGSRG